MVSFVLSFFPRDVLDEIWNLIESVSEGFPTYLYSVCTFMHSDQNLRNRNSLMVPMNFYSGNYMSEETAKIGRFIWAHFNVPSGEAVAPDCSMD